MAETQKGTSSSVNSKEKDSLLDLDFGKDFLSSWKCMSMTEDPMDLDFGPVSKGKKKAFNFDKVDMDFNIDGDFGKLKSFNVDMPDLGISSPLKKDAKTHDRSNKEPATGNNKGKADRLAFSFDFSELDGFNFKSSPRKGEIKAKKDEEKENSSNKIETQNSGDHQAEDRGDTSAHKDVMSRMPMPEALITPNLDTQVDACSDLPALENFPSKSTAIDNILLNSKAKVDDVESNEAVILLEKTISTNMQHSDCMVDKSISPEPVSKESSAATETIKAVSVHSTSRDKSSRVIVSELQDEVSSGAIRHIVSSEKDNGGSQFWSGEGTERSFGESIPNKEGNLMNQTPLEVSTNPLSRCEGTERALAESVPNKKGNLMNQNPLKASTNPLSSGLEQTMPSPTEGRSTAINLMAEIQREAFTTRSKYFKRPDKTEDLSSNASNQTKLFPLSDKVTDIRQPHLVDESSKSIMKEIRSDGKLTDISVPNSGAPVSKGHLKIGIQDHNKDLTLNRPLDQDVLKGKPVSGEGSKNVGSLDSVRLTRQTYKFTSQNSVNSANLFPNMPMLQTIKKNTPEGYKSYPSKAFRQMPALSSQKTSRISGTNLDSSNLIPPKDGSLKDSEKNGVLVGSRQSETLQSVETEKQTLLSPSLKRKMIEIPNADAVLKPSKRLSEPTSNRNSAEISKNVVDEEACNNENVVDGNNRSVLDDSQNVELDVPWELSMKEIEVPFSLENDSNVEKADACTKELEDICNMLRKKHDEAKDILVRAIVNNNKLLILNHPLYEEKIRMVQKFALQLTLRDVDTQT